MKPSFDISTHGLNSTAVNNNIGRLLVFCLFCILGTVFTTPYPSLACTLVMLIALPLVLFNPGRRAFLLGFFKGPERWFMWSFIAWPVSFITVSVVSGGWADGRYLDNPARFALSIPIAVLFARHKVDLKWLIAGVAVACVCSGLWGAYELGVLKRGRAVGLTNNEIHFGNLAAAACTIAIMYAAMAYQSATKWRVALLVCAVLGAFAALASGSRASGLAAFPLLALFFIRTKDTLHKQIIALIAVGLVCVAAGLVFSQSVREVTRISEASNDLLTYKKDRAQSSLGDRAEMWRASWLMFKENPLVGVGTRNYLPAYDKLKNSGLVKPGGMPYNQAHSQIFHTMAAGGTIFLAGYLFMLLAPAMYFYKTFRRSASNYTTRIASMLGFSSCLMFFGFGLTNAIFDIQLYSTVYPVLLASLAGICHQNSAKQAP